MALLPMSRSDPSSRSYKYFNRIRLTILLIGVVWFFRSPSSPSADLIEKTGNVIFRTNTAVSLEPPTRLTNLLLADRIVGDKLIDIQSGTMTIEEALHGQENEKSSGKNENAKKSAEPPMTMEEVIDFLSSFIHELHQICIKLGSKATYHDIWQAYHDLAVKTLYPWDRKYLQRMPDRRIDDDSLFLSLASYRDENCLNTITNAYSMAKNPDKLFVGLVQQNCEENCRSGVLVGGKMEDVEPDEDCHKAFCESPYGKQFCAKDQVRALHIQESESLGPYAARYFASKLWNGEQWYMQIDSHMTFAKNWDAISIQMLKKAPTKKPVISHYPPSEDTNFERVKTQSAPRLCHPTFATSEIESQIIRLQGNGFSKNFQETPRFAPFVAAGYFVAHSEFLREVPFDPFLPWIFMGEEIIMSARLWTHGYDIFSPTRSVVGHIYVRRHKPKFWESVHRVFHYGVHNPLQMMILDRVKHQMTYPEAARDMLQQKSVLTAVEQYTMGKDRSIKDYLKLAGLDMTKKEVTPNQWCNQGIPPEGFEEYNYLYE